MKHSTIPVRSIGLSVLFVLEICFVLHGCDDNDSKASIEETGDSFAGYSDTRSVLDAPGYDTNAPPDAFVPDNQTPDADDDAQTPADTHHPDVVMVDDMDLDGVPDHKDNCPDAYNPNQEDSDNDGKGDACSHQTPADGTPAHPFVIPLAMGGTYTDSRNTCQATSDQFDSYPPNDLDESGPEYVYRLTLNQISHVDASIQAPEPDGTDVDVHLVSSLSPLKLIERGHYGVSMTLGAGTYYLILDTYVDGQQNYCGPYDLTVQVTPQQQGTVQDVIACSGNVNTPLELPFWYEDSRDTSTATSDQFDSYPPNDLDESGPEYIYGFVVEEEVRLAARIRTPEPTGVDIDVHLLSSLSPLTLVKRGDKAVYAILQPGMYYLVLDTYVKDGNALPGPYTVSLSVRKRGAYSQAGFHPYILAAVDYIYANYGLLGYDSAVLTHDMPYGDQGVIPATGGAKTMCVAAVMEIILQAMNLYAEDTGDETVFDFLPASSWKTLHSYNIKAHIWVNPDLDSGGTADALRHFGMGDNRPFEQLRPGAFINLNRTTGTGHAVVFIGFIDANGKVYDTYNDSVVGFKYFSSQGGYDVDAGGMDYRYAIFDEYGSLDMPYKRDLHVMRSDNQTYLNSGYMFNPEDWTSVRLELSVEDDYMTTFDAEYFDGRTADDEF